MGPNGNFDVSMLTLDDKKVQPLLTSNFREADPAISPDGRWLAYTSNESGRLEVYVRPYPSGAGRWQVSDTGGGFPRWAGNGRELFYRVDDGIMVGVDRGRRRQHPHRQADAAVHGRVPRRASPASRSAATRSPTTTSPPTGSAS